MARCTRAMDTEERLHSLHSKDLKLQDSLHHSELVVKDEDVRRLRVRKQLQKDDIETLRDQLAQKDSQLSKLSSELQQAQIKIDTANEAQRVHQTQLRSSTRELANLKAEFESMNNASQESAKVLSEKWALSREISALKPELEHLRSQLVHQQTVIAEKLSLERQLNAAEVELAAEKRARQQMAEREASGRVLEQELRDQVREADKRLAVEKRDKERLQADAAAQKATLQDETTRKVEDDLKHRLQEAEAQIASTRREKERLRKESEVAASEAEAKIEMLEQRLGTMKSKLRTVQADLKTSRVELEKAQEALAEGASTARIIGVKSQAEKKRKTNDTNVPIAALGTADTDDSSTRRPAKKRGFDHTLVGEKSTFSVTPFLSRNKTLNMDALVEEDEDEANTSHVPQHTQDHQESVSAKGVPSDEEDMPDGHATQRPMPQVALKKAPGRPRGRPKKMLTEASPNLPVLSTIPEKKETAPKRNKAVPQKIAEEVEGILYQEAESLVTESTHSLTGEPTGAIINTQGNGKTSTQEQEAKKKKRRLMGDASKLALDNVDEEVESMEIKTKRPAKMQVGLGRMLGKQKMGMSRTAFGGTTFSPLKKDRRGVHASFLA